MIRQIRASYFPNFKNAEYCALSTDTIPNYVKDGDIVYLIDQGKRCIYDAVSGTLVPQQSSGGGGLPSGGSAGQVIMNDGSGGGYWVTLGFVVDENGILDIGEIDGSASTSDVVGVGEAGYMILRS